MMSINFGWIFTVYEAKEILQTLTTEIMIKKRGHSLTFMYIFFMCRSLEIQFGIKMQRLYLLTLLQFQQITFFIPLLYVQLGQQQLCTIHKPKPINPNSHSLSLIFPHKFLSDSQFHFIQQFF